MNIVVVQPALPAYRYDLFERVHAYFGGRFSVHFSPTHLSGITTNAEVPVWARRLGLLRGIAPGLEWQAGAVSIEIGKGDVLIICGAPRTLSTLVLIAKAKLVGAKVIWWGHFWSSTSKQWRFRLRLQMLRACDGILFYTDAEAAEYRAMKDGRYGDSVWALNNGINIDPISSLRAPFDPAARDNAALFIGRLTPKAGLTFALDALALIPAGSRPRLDVIGAGEEQERLQAQTRALRLDDHVVWHGATTDETRIARIANRCRLFVYPGEVGLSLIHAMAYGLPALVHADRWRQMPEFTAFENGVTGRSFPYGQAHALANAWMEMTTDEATLSTWSASALLRVNATFNTQDMARRFIAVVRRFGDDGALPARGDGGGMEGAE